MTLTTFPLPGPGSQAAGRRLGGAEPAPGSGDYAHGAGANRTLPRSRRVLLIGLGAPRDWAVNAALRWSTVRSWRTLRRRSGAPPAPRSVPITRPSSPG